MKPFMTQLSERNVEVESEIRLAKAQADHQYQLLQVKERELANASLRDFTFWKRRQVEEIRAMRLHRERLEARKYFGCHGQHLVTGLTNSA